MKLESVKGISSKKAEALRANEYLFAECLARASAHRVAQIPNCSPALVANAQRYIDMTTDFGDVNYICEECGNNFKFARGTLRWHTEGGCGGSPF